MICELLMLSHMWPQLGLKTSWREQHKNGDAEMERMHHNFVPVGVGIRVFYLITPMNMVI